MRSGVTPVQQTRSTCCYCGVGCGVVIESDGAHITNVVGDPSHPANYGKLCTKGATLALTMSPLAQRGRARNPELRLSRQQPRATVDWDTALDHVADQFAQTIREHGPDSVAFYVSGQLLTEDYYVFNKLAKGLIGTANIDTNSRLCMASAVTGYQKTLGVDAPPCSYEDIELAECLFIAGSNTAWAHPILYRRIESARERNPALKVIVVDPRRTETAAAADLHLAILPGTDVALFHGMLNVMLWEERVNREFIAAHTEGFEALRDIVRDMQPSVAAGICGINADDIITAARWFASAKATLSLYCQGLNQSTSGTAKNATLVGLHLATGQIGKPGAGPFSLTGQPNAMGGREVGGMATTLAAHRDLSNKLHRAEVQQLWGVEKLPEERGKTAVEMFDAIRKGEIKAIWIACTNPAQSMPDLRGVTEALKTAELVVLQDAYANTETAPFADVLLPATSWGEKDGTVTNSERRISRVRPAVQKPHAARHDWEIAVDFARRLEKRLRVGQPTLFDFEGPEQVWNEHRALTRGRDLDITGLSYDALNASPQQWPFPEGAVHGATRLYEDGVFPTSSGRAQFFAEAWRQVAEKTDARFPLALNTGRLRDHWHGMSRTGSIPRLFGHSPEPALLAQAADLARRGIASGDLVKVESKRGAMHCRAEASDTLRSGQVYLPMHWGKRFLGGADSAGVNGLTQPAFDLHSRQPELKHAAVKISRAELAWHMTAFVLDEDSAANLLDELQSMQDGVAFFSAVPVGRMRSGLVIRAAHSGAPDVRWLAQLDRLLGLAGDIVMRYDDARRECARRLSIVNDKLVALRVSGGVADVESGEWLREWGIEERPVGAIRRLLLAPVARAPEGFVPAGRVICQCLDISESAISETLGHLEGDTAGRCRSLMDRLHCGTQCGSCVPELKSLVARVPFQPKSGASKDAEQAAREAA